MADLGMIIEIRELFLSFKDVHLIDRCINKKWSILACNEDKHKIINKIEPLL